MAYEITVVITNDLKFEELKIWAFNFGKLLKRLKATDIYLQSRGKKKLKYKIRNKNRANLVQINFGILPDDIPRLINELKFDSNVLRFLLFKTSESGKKPAFS